MSKQLSADDILPLVACLTAKERFRLLQLISGRRGGSDAEAYRTLHPADDEFSSEEEPLAWDSDGWESLA